MKYAILLSLLLLPACTSAATPSAPASAARLTVTSTAFADGGTIPQKYTCQGDGISPELKWGGAPASTASYALILDDPDAPNGTFTHWVAFDLPANQTEVPEGAPPAGKEGKNSAGRTGYVGPCPPSGTHRYIFTIYALDIPSLKLESPSRAQVLDAMAGHILASGQLTGRYGK
ncbi:MAG: YbhB/YbcL family Raf kinase inhibitor-like protein [Rudaea sp.]